ncbi:hypothetical protein EJ04DRAFT_508758 [Polyplosphaeria fusca]|uniref:Uncharacterized protein n=1 Tax=Polyplosphaeria fusca TaxID=682080 RepID=A0A9P4R967_9PLEO|nr:hypothetical protein EJ04DRAFT_508758 [Polyplosphaeria fusca]
MAVDNTLLSLLATLTTSIQAATEALPGDGNTTPSADGISLLDVKHDLLLSYLQNLVFLILLKLRSRNQGDQSDIEDTQDEVIRKLVELRVYLDKGIRPLENRVKYQIDKIIRATDDSGRRAAQETSTTSSKRSKRKSKPDRASDSAESGSESGGLSQNEDDEVMDRTAYGPRGAQMVRSGAAGDSKTTESSKDGIYRPPRITPTAMPTSEAREEKGSKRPGKSATLDEFVATELSTAPLAEPSIGSTIVSGGRRMKSDKERREEAERREYEESNFVRLPKASKQERAKQRGRDRPGGWAGEEWRGLDAGLNRIDRLTQKKSGSMGALERSRKRPNEDRARGSGMDAGEAFEKRRKIVSRYR